MGKWALTGFAVILWIVLGAGGSAAQDSAAPAPACAAAAEAIWTAASIACISGPIGYICNGGSPPLADPAGPVANALNPMGALVEVGAVKALRTTIITAETGTGGLVWIRVPQPNQYTALLVGDAATRDITPEGFPAWQSILVQTAETLPGCPALPHNSYMAQTPLNQPVSLVINGASITLNGTLLVQTQGEATLFAGLSGQHSIYALGAEQILRPGQVIAVSHAGSTFGAPSAPPGAPQPLDTAMEAGLPVALLDRPIILPQPGYVTTEGQVNMRVAPTTDAAVLAEVPPGQVLSILGRDPSGEWYHVRLDSGETGWMYASLLNQNVGNIQAVYSATPLPPQRYGEMGYTATVLAPVGANMRQAPDVTFPWVLTIPDKAKVTLIARSPYSPWVKVDFNGTVGWLALITLQTQAVIEALPVDVNVPPLPEPTRVPGSFGNAFPDPNGKGN
jgi:uncharacterized protein YgiM (DUF1202 family)